MYARLAPRIEASLAVCFPRGRTVATNMIALACMSCIMHLKDTLRGYMMSTEKTTLKGRLQKKQNSKFLTIKSTKNQLRTSLGCRSTRNDMKVSGIDMESP